MFKNLLELFGKTNEDGVFLLNQTGYAIFIIAMIAILLFAVFVNRNSSKLKTKQLVFAGMAIALAFVTSYIKLFKLPFGGSITLGSMFFICFIGYLYGLKMGLTTAIAYGIFQLISDPYIIHPMQLLYDYILGFGALGLSGLFHNKKSGLIKGYLVGVTGRFICSVLSGYIFFGAYAPESMNPLLYSVLYNGSYIYLEAGLTVLLLCGAEFFHAFGHIKKLANDF